MSGYLHSGLTRQDYDDRAALRAALEVIHRRWEERSFTSPRVSVAANVLGDLAREIEGSE